MITYFPNPYPDELFYSMLARYYTKSGYLAYTFAAEELFSNKTSKPRIEFINPLSETAFKIITDIIPFRKIIENHTMFSYYTRFLPLERRKEAYQALLNMQSDYYKYLCIPKDNQIQHLKYCPLCADVDRNKYGETYWHRIHQFKEIDICPDHHCLLIDSDIIISGKGTPSLITAEEAIPVHNDVIYCIDNLKCKIADYMSCVFNMELDFISKVGIGDFLHSKMENTKYLSLRGEQRNMTLLYSDFCKYYADIERQPEEWKLQKIFNNRRYKLYEICLLALFLNVPYNELQFLKLPRTTQYQIFDSKITELHNNGLNYAQISRELNASYIVVKSIGENRYKNFRK